MLLIGVDTYKLNTLNTFLDHAIYCVVSAAADTYYYNLCR